MVWPITGGKSYVGDTGKSMRAPELAVPQKGCWCNIPVTTGILPGLLSRCDNNQGLGDERNPVSACRPVSLDRLQPVSGRTDFIPGFREVPARVHLYDRSNVSPCHLRLHPRSRVSRRLPV